MPQPPATKSRLMDICPLPSLMTHLYLRILRTRRHANPARRPTHRVNQWPTSPHQSPIRTACRDLQARHPLGAGNTLTEARQGSTLELQIMRRIAHFRPPFCAYMYRGSALPMHHQTSLDFTIPMAARGRKTEVEEGRYGPLLVAALKPGDPHRSYAFFRNSGSAGVEGGVLGLSALHKLES